MFGESDSESPRVPSPWDSVISSPPTPSPPLGYARTPSPLACKLVPRLVPEADDGNVEYKLQLLSPSPARFARLVTQLKWRLLEGGGQAYYELGVADSGDLVGLTRDDLEHSLETLEMMAGEIGASVIVVKEIMVPAAIAELNATHKERKNDDRVRQQNHKYDHYSGSSSPGYTSTSTIATTETEAESITAIDTADVDYEEKEDDLLITVDVDANAIIQQATTTDIPSVISPSVLSLELDPDPGDVADAETDDDHSQSELLIDLEISIVYKPRPVRVRAHANHAHVLMNRGKNKRMKKIKQINSTSITGNVNTILEHGEGKHSDRSVHRRQVRDRRRAESKKTAISDTAQESKGNGAVNAENHNHSVADAAAPARKHKTSHDPNDGSSTLSQASVDIPDTKAVLGGVVPAIEINDFDNEWKDDNNDVFATPSTTSPSIPTFAPSSIGESHLNVNMDYIQHANLSGNDETRLIVEVLVVRKLSMEEAFIDFEGFSLV